jgi:hypothetical protein
MVNTSSCRISTPAQISRCDATSAAMISANRWRSGILQRRAPQREITVAGSIVEQRSVDRPEIDVCEIKEGQMCPRPVLNTQLNIDGACRFRQAQTRADDTVMGEGKRISSLPAEYDVVTALVAAHMQPALIQRQVRQFAMQRFRRNGEAARRSYADSRVSIAAPRTLSASSGADSETSRPGHVAPETGVSPPPPPDFLLVAMRRRSDIETLTRPTHQTERPRLRMM